MVEQSKKTQMGLVMTGPKGEREVKEIPIPKPGKGQVLIKVECHPINPSDTYAFDGLMADAAPDEVHI
jgi:NADPH:quinone reductase-like Zn-dependent oxidoreductase